MSQKPEALRLATILDSLGWRSVDSELREASAMLRNQHAEIERLRAELAESATDLSRVLETVKYLSGIAERGEGRKIGESETVEQFVLGYAQKLETEIERLRAELEALRKQEPVAWAEMIADAKEVFDADGSETPQVVRDVIEYVASWCEVYADKSRAAGAQPALGWLRAVDDAMVCSHLGTAEARDDYATAKRKLNELICWNVAVEKELGAQPAPSAPEVTDTMALAFHCALTAGRISAQKVDEIKVGLRAALAAAPETPKHKPLTDAMVEAAGRALSDRHANGCGCGMDKDIMWGSYSDEFKEQARVALEAAHGIKENSND